MNGPSASARIRAFVAVEIGEAARRSAAEVSRLLRSRPGGDEVRWVRPESLHITLRFLGDVEPAVVPKLVACVAEGVRGLECFEARLAGVHGFPSVRRPRVVVLDVAPRESLEALAAAVERGAVAAGLAPESRPFRPHLTLGRVRGRAAPDLEGAPEPAPAPFPVREAVLFRSELRRSGARYIPLERMALGRQPSP